MTVRLLFPSQILIAGAVVANVVVASLPDCHDDCTRLDADKNDTCADFDPVVCCSTVDPEIYQCKEASTSHFPDPSTFCDLPNADNHSLAPPGGLQYELLDYGQGSWYGFRVWWYQPLDDSELLHYQIAFNEARTTKLSQECIENSETLDKDQTEFVSKRKYPYFNDADYFVQVAAIPLFVWNLTITVLGTGITTLCSCPGCSNCEPPPSPPANLNWTRNEDDPFSTILSWEHPDHTDKSTYYLHLNSSVHGKLLYRVEGKLSVVMTNLVGEVTVWLESYGCGCSESTSEQLSFTIDNLQTASTTVFPSQTSFAITTINSPSSSSILSSSTDVPPSVEETSVSQPSPSSTSAVTGTPSLTSDPLSTSTAPPHLVAIVVSVSVIALTMFLVLFILTVVMVKYQAHCTHEFESKKVSDLPPGPVEEKCYIERLHDFEMRNKAQSNDGKFREQNTLPPPPTVEIVYSERRYENGMSENNALDSEAEPVNNSAPYVLLIFSQNTPHSDQNVIRSYGFKLNHAVAVRMYDVADRLTRTAWLERNYGQAAAILCVCNESFAMEWRNASTSAGGSIVSAVKMIVQGQIEHQALPEKFAALYLYEDDRKLTPPYLKNVRSFILCPENIEDISRFALSINEYGY